MARVRAHLATAKAEPLPPEALAQIEESQRSTADGAARWMPIAEARRKLTR